MARPHPPLFQTAITTRQAYDGAATVTVLHHLLAGGWIDAPTAQAAEIAVHEGVANAIIHGNLEMPGLSAFVRVRGNTAERYYDEITRRLRTGLGARMLHITCRNTARLLVIHIDDSGPGYTPAPAPPPSRRGDAPQASGNGWPLMRAFSRRIRVSRSGRRLSLGFARPVLSSS